MVAGVDPAGVLGQRREQVELAPRERDLAPVDEHAVGVVLDDERPAPPCGAGPPVARDAGVTNALTLAASSFGETGFVT